MASKCTVLSVTIFLTFLYCQKNTLAAVDPRFASTTNEQYGILGEILFHSKTFPNENVWGNNSNINATTCSKDSSLNQLHVGVDYSTSSNGSSLRGAMVFSATSGVVKKISRGQPCSNSNNCLSTLVIYHEKTQTSFIYLHMETIDPSLIEDISTISIGQNLGTVGARGLVTGSHLHFEARLVNSQPFVGIKTLGALCIDGTINPFEAVITAQEADSTPCDTLHSGANVPDGFGVPWNVFDPNQLLLKASCTSSSVTVDVGPATYVYNP